MQPNDLDQFFLRDVIEIFRLEKDGLWLAIDLHGATGGMLLIQRSHHLSNAPIHPLTLCALETSNRYPSLLRHDVSDNTI
jgi:hypothetical protein